MPIPGADAEMEMSPARRPVFAFTLIELLVVILIIAVLMGIAFPVFQGVMNSAKKTQAKNDLMQIVTAVNAFYTEYGRYPTRATSDATSTYGSANSNKALFDELRAITGALNTRQVVFLSPPEAKDAIKPRNGIAGATSASAGQYFDPWGIAYSIRIDWDYDNQVPNPYTGDTGAGSTTIRSGVIAWSLGKDQRGGTGSKASPDSKDDVISWQ
jgi:prepilin-type N-terminal cleavage/methylation domain-containing protein